MKRFILILTSLILCSELHSQENTEQLNQEIRYIRDVLYVPVRSGQTSKHRIVHKGLISGTKLFLLDNDEDSGYSLIRTEKGTQGWIPNRYLSFDPAGRDLHQQAQQRITQLQQKNSTLTLQLAKLRTQDKQSQNKITEFNSQNQDLNNKLKHITQLSANAIALDSENKKLSQLHQSLKNQVDVLTADNKNLLDNNENDAFLNGVFAVLIGVVIALIVPRLRSKKSSEWA
ncbi:MAG: TIGR04211 family SH3 domain-containing protein [Spongiibacteraceae bacterium]|nr:TIGR04211 family SH3 domain-containing protein [Spongiibacteraceae bacterium]